MFKNFLLKAEKTFKFRIKSMMPLCDDKMDVMEKVLFKYRPVSVSAPKKTMFHTNPLGYTGAKHGEIWFTDVELSVPVTASILELAIREAYGFDKVDGTIRAFAEGDVQEADDESECCPEEAEEEIEERGALMTNENYEEVEEADFSEFYGDDYNSSFTAFLKEFEAKRKEAVGAGEVDPAHPIVKAADHTELGSELNPEQKGD